MSIDYTAEMAHAAVERGAAWLDKHCPTWFREINLDRLNLGNPTFCVLGQTAKCLLGEKNDGRAMRGGFYEIDSAARFVTTSPLYEQGWNDNKYGFNVPGGWLNQETTTQFEMLTLAWREYIRNRLEAVAP